VALDFLPGQAPLMVAGGCVHAPFIGQGLGGLQGLGLAGDAVRGGGRQGQAPQRPARGVVCVAGQGCAQGIRCGHSVPRC